MTGYLCKYAPIEILDGFGIKAVKIPTEKIYAALTSSDESYEEKLVEAVLTSIRSMKLDAIISTDCSPLMVEIADVIEEQEPEIRVYRVSLPRLKKGDGPSKYAHEVKMLIQSISKDTAIPFDMQKFISSIEKQSSGPIIKHLAVVGAEAPSWLQAHLDQASSLPWMDYTCGVQQRRFGERKGATAKKQSIIDWYAQQLLTQYAGLAGLWQNQETLQLVQENIAGIIHIKQDHTLCSVAQQDFAKKHSPMLLLEDIFVTNTKETVLKEVDRFLHKNEWYIDVEETGELAEQEKPPIKLPLKKQHYLGIDVGTMTTSVVVINEQAEIVLSTIEVTNSRLQWDNKDAINEILAAKGLSVDEIKAIVATGYGRSSVLFASDDYSELDCQAAAAYYYSPEIRTVIDVGASDCKIIEMDSDARVINFRMNDKCVAGTGRFLDAMAQMLDVNLDELSQLAEKATEDLTITNACPVLADDEIQVLLDKQASKADIAYAIYQAAANYLFGMVVSGGYPEEYFFTGGMANNHEIVDLLSEQLDANILVADYPQITAALGAAILGLKN